MRRGGGREAELNDFLRRVDDELHRGGRKRTWLAQRAGIPIGTMNGWFNYDRMPGIPEAIAIAQVLGRSVEYLATGDDPGLRSLPAESAEMCHIMEELNPHERDQMLRAVRALAPVMIGRARAPKAAEA